MRIDNSAARTFWICPALYWEKYVQGIQKKPGESETESREFGKRVHELLEDHFKDSIRTNESVRPASVSVPERGVGPQSIQSHVPHVQLPRSVASPAVESEAQELIAAYCAYYPTEPFEVISVERTFELPIPGSGHTVTGKMDGFVRGTGWPYEPDGLYILEHKSEKRGSVTNLPDAWASRAQVGIYQWAAEQIYGRCDGIILDVLTRRSPAGRIGPEFRRDTLQRSHSQQLEALRDIVYVADQIEMLMAKYGKEIMWPANRNNCMQGRFRCEFYTPHTYGRDELVLIRDYQPTEKYLDL